MIRPFDSFTYGGKRSAASPGAAMTIVPPGASVVARGFSPAHAVARATRTMTRAELRMRGWSKWAERVGATGPGGSCGRWRGRNGEPRTSTTSSVPSPRVVFVVDDETRGAGTKLIIENEWFRARIFYLADRRRQYFVKVVCRRRPAERRGEGRRRRNLGLRLRPHLGQHTLLILHQDGTVLQERSIRTPLRAAGELAAIQRELASPRLVETRRRSWRGAAGFTRGNPSVDAKSGETGDEQPVDALVRLTKIARVAHRRGDAV